MTTDSRTPFAWADDLATAASVCQPGVMPVLAPASANRADRWRRALAWYGEARRPPPAAHTGYVLGLGEAGGLVGALLATALGRSFASASTRSDAEEWLRRAGARSALVVATAEFFRCEDVLRLTLAAREATTRLGLLTARDVPGLTFAGAKVLAGWLTQPPPGATDEVVDGLVADPDDPVPLDKEWRALTLVGHGDGAHLKLGSAVVCGLSADAERTTDAVVVPGCSAAACKKIQSPAAALARACDLRARLVVLLTCNGSDVAGDLYPSDVSLVLGALEGHAAGVLTTLGQTSASQSTAERSQRALRDGLPLAQVVDRLDSSSIIDEALPAHVVWGDPEWTLAAGARPLTPPRQRIRASAAPEALRKLADCRRLVIDAESIERGVVAVAFDSIGAQDDFAASLTAVADARRIVEARLWRAAAAERQSLPAALQRVDAAAADWDERFAELVHAHLLDEVVPGAQVGDVLIPALHAFHRLQDVWEGAPCPRCGTTTFLRRVVCPEMALTPRTSRICVACGALDDHSDGSAAPALTLEPIGAPGGQTTLALRLADAPEAGPFRVVMQVRDKSKPRAFFAVRRCVDRGAEVRIGVPIPADAGYDLYSARAVVVRGMRVSFARVLSALVPPTR